MAHQKKDFHETIKVLNQIRVEYIHENLSGTQWIELFKKRGLKSAETIFKTLKDIPSSFYRNQAAEAKNSNVRMFCFNPDKHVDLKEFVFHYYKKPIKSTFNIDSLKHLKVTENVADLLIDLLDKSPYASKAGKYLLNIDDDLEENAIKTLKASTEWKYKISRSKMVEVQEEL